MKYVKRSIPVIVLLVLIIGAVLLLHPVRVYTQASYTYQVKVTGMPLELDGIGDIAGGYRCYLDDEHYIYLSSKDCEVVYESAPIYLRYGFPWERPVVNKGGSN